MSESAALAPIARDDLDRLIGQELGLSRWFSVDQARIDDFAEVTEDRQFIHVDPEAAARTPFGGTIAHGFLTLSMLSAMSYDAVPRIAGARMGINYGFDRIRFLAPVPAGARLRGRFVLAARRSHPDHETLTWATTVEIEGQRRPALSADWIGRQVFERPTA